MKAQAIRRLPASAALTRGGASDLIAGPRTRDASHSVDPATAVQRVLARSGQPLDSATHAFFTARLGHDFANVRVHAGADAAESARAVNARAFTVGRDVVFDAGQFAPHTRAGRELLAHELTHVVQQGDVAGILQRAPDDEPVEAADPEPSASQKLQDAFKDPMGAAREFAIDQLNELANEPSSKPSVYSHTGCPATFCQPFDNYSLAQGKLKLAGAAILAGIREHVGSAVLPQWALYMNGGCSQIDLSAKFGADFAQAGRTAGTTRYLRAVLRRDIEMNQDSLLGAADAVELDFSQRLAVELDEIERPGGPQEMVFIGGIPGNIAGGVGDDQTAHPIGNRPSPQNDSRDALVRATLTRAEDGSVLVAPEIRFTVLDTIDLCPGHCGAPPEHAATIPLSRFEATGVTGDVPFIVEFAAPAAELLPFTIAAKEPPKP